MSFCEVFFYPLKTSLTGFCITPCRQQTLTLYQITEVTVLKNYKDVL